MNKLDHIIKGACLEGPYRYELNRVWAVEFRQLTVIMLNPSTADAFKDDPTIRRCMRFAEDNGYASMKILNLFAYRATKPPSKWTPEHVGPRNDDFILSGTFNKSVLCAWGTKADPNRVKAVMDILAENDCSIFCLGTTKDGHPRHPLYVKASQKLVEFKYKEPH